jgi:hypothetical protein
MLEWLRLSKRFVIHTDANTNLRGVKWLGPMTKPGTEIVFVPLASMMTESVAKAKFPNVSTHSALALWLLKERRDPNSFCAPYLHELPSLTDMPLFWDVTKRHALLPSLAGQMLQTRLESLALEHAALQTTETLDDFLWARTIVITRVFQCGSQGTCLVPFADLMNHSHSPNVAWGYDEARKGFVMRAAKTLLRGSVLYDSYGKKCNSRFFVNYGFVLGDNDAWNQCIIYLPRGECDKSQYDDGFTGKITVPDGYVAFQVPILHTDNSERSVMKSMVAHAKSLVNNHEARAFQLIGECAKKRLDTLSAIKAAEIVDCEKRSLQFYVQLGQSAMAKDFKRRYPLWEAMNKK